MHQPRIESLIQGYDFVRLMEAKEVEPPEKLNPKLFSFDGTPTEYLIQLRERVELEFEEVAVKGETLLGIYLHGSQANGSFHEDSDIDIWLHALTNSEERRVEISDLLIIRINNLDQALSQAKAMGIDLHRITTEELIERGLLLDGEVPSGIIILERLGLIKKGNIVDVYVSPNLPSSRLYDLRKREWVRFNVKYVTYTKAGISQYQAQSL